MESETQAKESPPKMGRIEKSLLTIDSSIRNGQFIYALRETNKLIAEIRRGELTTGGDDDELLSSLNRTGLFLRPMVAAYSQNQCSIGIARRSKCKTTSH